MSIKAIHPVTEKPETIRVYTNHFKLKSAEFPNGESFPLNSLTIVCSTCEQKECVCLQVA
jgi:hypothetical protein